MVEENLTIEQKAERYDLMYKYLTVNEFASIKEIQRLQHLLKERGIEYEL